MSEEIIVQKRIKHTRATVTWVGKQYRKENSMPGQQLHEWGNRKHKARQNQSRDKNQYPAFNSESEY